ncbi:ureidoglycolate lyase [Marinobacter salarius]|uniref:ureidoglycolate lyase n=1 Tax=Marinobacter salarius TaxID=1420917 RepID=UPI0032EAF89C
MSTLELRAEPLTRQAFAPFGDVIEVAEDNQVIPINYGSTERHHDLAALDVEDGGGRAIVSIFRTRPVSLPFRVKVMERHPLGSQAFIMTTGNPYLVVVAPPGEFEPAALRAFQAAPGQGVNYHKGVWHHYCLGLYAVNDFLVIDRAGAGDNCEEIAIPGKLQIYIVR